MSRGQALIPALIKKIISVATLEGAKDHENIYKTHPSHIIAVLNPVDCDTVGNWLQAQSRNPLSGSGAHHPGSSNRYKNTSNGYQTAGDSHKARPNSRPTNSRSSNQRASHGKPNPEYHLAVVKCDQPIDWSDR